MSGRVGRAEALAAVALVVGAGREPVAAFQRLAAEDPALAVLRTLAARCAAGTALPDALVACRLIPRAAVAGLHGLPPALLADELTRLARLLASPPPAERLARWLPLWALLAAVIPSLLIGAVVAMLGDGLYGGIWHSLGLTPPIHGPAAWWLAQVAQAGVAALLVLVLWMLLRRVPWARRVTVFSPRLERASALATLVRLARAGGDHQAAFATWARLSGDRAGVRTEHAAGGGEVTTTLMRLGVVPRGADGRPDWDVAVAETAHAQELASVALMPWLVSVLVLVGMSGFMTWELAPVRPLLEWQHWSGHGPQLWEVLAAPVFALLKLAGAAVLVLHLLLLAGQVLGLAAGAGVDLALVADRLARALDRREDPDTVLRGLRLGVSRAMRRRIDAALAQDPATPLGIRLVEAGIIPRAQAQALRSCPPADLPALLRSVAHEPPDHGLRAAALQARVLLLLAVVLAGIQSYVLVGIIPRFRSIFQSTGIIDATHLRLSEWALGVSFGVIACGLLAALVHAAGQRAGWWLAGGGWPRLARGLVARRLLAAGAAEGDLARALGAMAPRLAPRLDDAARRGDLPGLCAAAGWPVASPAALEQALSTDLLARDRRRARMGLAARLVLPLVLGLPIALTAVSVNLSVLRLSQHAVGLAAHDHGGTFGGGSAGMALIYWWVQRCEAQGTAAVEQVRVQAAPPATPAAVPR